MKALSLFLCLYLMLLSVLPCSDVEECNESIQMSISQSIDHDNHSHEMELCSPFCICVCCGQFTNFTNTSTDLIQITAYSATEPVMHQSGFPLDVHLAIWQPPKIS